MNSLIPAFIKRSIFTNLIAYIIWDFDGTLYQSKELADELRKEYVKILKELKNDASEKEFDQQTAQKGSWSAAVANLTGWEENKIINEVERRFDKTLYIPENKDIVRLISKLGRYRHIIVSNSTTTQIIEGLKKIGFPDINRNNINPFELIIGRDTMRCLKPDIRFLQKVHSYTGLPKFRHIFIGDSYYHDIAPARKFGFRAIYLKDIFNYFWL